MQEAGANAVLELAYTIADGIEYLRTGKLFCKSLFIKLGYSTVIKINNGYDTALRIDQVLAISFKNNPGLVLILFSKNKHDITFKFRGSFLNVIYIIKSETLIMIRIFLKQY